MAKGNPDIYGYPQYPKIGPVVDDTVVGFNIPSGVLTTVHNIAGKGVILGGNLSHVLTMDSSVTELVLTIDGAVAMTQSPDLMWRAGARSAESGPIFLTYFNLHFERFSLAFSRGITFEQSYVFQILQTDGLNRDVWSSVFYTRIL